MQLGDDLSDEHSPVKYEPRQQIARERKIYWILPMVMFVVLMGLFIFVGETAAPLLYTLF